MFIDNVVSVATQVFILFVLVAVGFLCNKVKLINKETVKQMTDFVLYAVTSCVIVSSFNRDFDAARLKGLIIMFASAIAAFVLNIVLSRLTIKDKNESRKKILRYGAVFSNAGFMALPLQEAILGEDGVFYGAIYVAVYNVVNWTYGIFLMSGDKKYISPKKAVLNPGVLGTIVGLAIFFSPFTLPQIAAKLIEYLAALNTPLPMVIIGFHLANASFKIKGFPAYFTMAFRLILSPLLIFLIMRLIGIDSIITTSIVIAVSAPFAVTNTMFTEKFGGDTQYSASMVSVTTLLSIITMPIVIGISMM